VISRLDPLHQALTTGVALPSQPEHVQNLNYLQCSWAHSAVYSNRREFAFARRVFRENPHYREVPTTSLIDMIALGPRSNRCALIFLKPMRASTGLPLGSSIFELAWKRD
jgi:hypothetical protein